MQPCPTCGGVGIDANGYCTNCRAYRGIPQQPPPPTSGAPYSGAPYSGAPAAYHVSGPSFPDQVSSPPFPPTTYGGQYGAPTTPPKKRNSFMVPLLALSGVLALLVVGIVVVVVVKNTGDTPTTPTANGKGIDACVIGTWETTKYTEQVAVDGVGDVPFTLSKNGPVVKFSKEGKGSQNYDGTLFTANMPISGQTVKVELEANASVKFDFGTNQGTMSFSNLENSGKGVVRAPAANFTEEQDWEGSDDPSKYSCSGDEMTMSTSRYNAELKRTSSTA